MDQSLPQYSLKHQFIAFYSPLRHFICLSLSLKSLELHHMFSRMTSHTIIRCWFRSNLPLTPHFKFWLRHATFIGKRLHTKRRHYMTTCRLDINRIVYFVHLCQSHIHANFRSGANHDFKGQNYGLTRSWYIT